MKPLTLRAKVGKRTRERAARMLDLVACNFVTLPSVYICEDFDDPAYTLATDALGAVIEWRTPPGGGVTKAMYAEAAQILREGWTPRKPGRP